MELGSCLRGNDVELGSRLRGNDGQVGSSLIRVGFVLMRIKSAVSIEEKGDRVLGTLVDGTWNVPTTLTFVGLGTCTYFGLEQLIYSSIDKPVNMNVVVQAFDLNIA